MKTTTLALLASAALALPAFAGDCASKAKATTAEAPAHVIPAQLSLIGSAHAAETKTAGTIVDIAAGDERFTTLVAALKAAGLVETLAGEGPFTVFAPTNDAFAKLPAGTVENLLKPENKAQLTAVLTYHVVAGEVFAKDLAGKTTDAKTVNGATVKADGTNGVKINDATVIAADVDASNGLIHVIDTVLLPPATTN